MSDDLTTVIPQPIVAKINGETVEIRQIRVGQLPRALRLIHPFYEQLKALRAESEAAVKEGREITQGLDMYTLVMEHSESVLDLVALLTNHDREWVDNLQVDELVALLSAVLEVNADFFIRRVLPSLSGLGTDITKQIKSVAGQTPSKL